MEQLLRDRVAIVTGASQGIGRGVALAFANHGASIVAAARNANMIEDTCRAIEQRGGQALPVPCDVQRLSDIEHCVAQAVDGFGGIDILVNNAQNIRTLRILDTEDRGMVDALESGPLAVFRFMRAAHPYLKARGGVVVNVGSSSTHLPTTMRYGPYNGAKYAIEGLTYAAADEWGEDGIRVFQLHPAAESAMTERWKSLEPEKYAAAMSALPAGRLGDAELDVGRPLAWVVANADAFTRRTVNLSASGAYLRAETFFQEPISVALPPG